jgi:V/A-type H+-transporting ATPase subunit C
MKPLKYKEIMPRVAIEKLKLIKEEDLVDLTGRNLEAIRCALLETPYRDTILKISKQEVDSISLEEALLENYAQTIRNLVKFSSGNIKNVLLAIVKKLEILNVKTLLRAAKAKMDIDEAVRHIIPLGKLNKDRCRDILSASLTVEGVIETLSNSEYPIIIKEALVERNSAEDLLALEIALDRIAYQKIFESIKKLKGLDKLIAKNVLGIEADAINVKIILRFKARGIPKDLIKEYFMPSFLINERILERALETTDVKTLAECLLKTDEIAKNPYYKNVFVQILNHWNSPLSQLEDILERAPLRISFDMKKKYLKYYNIGSVLVFLNLKWFEIRNLRCLIVGSKRKIKPAQIKRLLILQNTL